MIIFVANYKHKYLKYEKNLLTISFLSITIFYNAQVGVNTELPLATLDVKEKRTTGVNDTSAKDGVMIPKLTKTELASKTATAYTTAQNGTIIYLSDATGGTTGTSVAQVTNINAVGFYYFDATASPMVWRKLDTDTNTNLYNTDGTLSSARVVTQGANTLAFTGTATNAYSVDGTTLSVDAANDRVGIGIGTAAPTSKLHVVGDAKITSLPVSTSSSVPVYWNSTTGQVQSFPTGKKPFNTYKYTVRLTNSDWISDLNLNISSTDYTVIVTSAQFRLLNDASSTAGAMGGVSLNNQSIATVTQSFSTANSARLELIKLTVADKDARTFVSGGTWHIYADYRDAAPVSSTTYEWVFEVLVINNSMVKTGTAQVTTIAAGQSTASVAAPADL